MNRGTAARPLATAEVAALLTEVAGLRTDDERSAQVTDRIAQAMRDAGVSGSAYRELLEGDPDAFQGLIRLVTVGETHFFRESGQLDLLRGRILPGLLRDRPQGHQLQVWSAGCSTGEEAYTLAILLEEEGLAGRSSLLATDICEDALRRARSARYRAWSLRGVEPRRREAYFQVRDDQFELHRRFVDRVSFRLLNLVADPYPRPGTGGFDVIFCRNVLIYLTPEACAAVVDRLTAALAPGGWLITASTDPHLSAVPGLRVIASNHAVAYQRVTGTRTPGDRPPPAPAPGAGRSHAVPAMRRPGRRLRPDERPAVRQPADPCPTPSQRPDASRGATSTGIDPEAEREYSDATSLLEEGRWEDAVQAARRALYLEPELVVAHVVLGHAASRAGDRAGAERAWRNVRTALEQLDPNTSVPLAGGTSAGRLLVEVRQLATRRTEAP